LLQHRKCTPRISRDGVYCWEFSRNTASGLPDYAFDALISRRRVLGFDSLLLSDPDGVKVCADDSNEKYKHLVSRQPCGSSHKVWEKHADIRRA
jgi:hypothetical protein